MGPTLLRLYELRVTGKEWGLGREFPAYALVNDQAIQVSHPSAPQPFTPQMFSNTSRVPGARKWMLCLAA